MSRLLDWACVGALGLGVCVSACSKASGPPGPTASAAPSSFAPTPTNSPGGAAPSAAVSARVGASSGPALGWRGPYKSVPGTVTIPSSLKAGTWTNGETDAALGEGTLSLEVDPETRRVSGALDGPLGPAAIAGFFADGKLAAAVRRKNPADQGFAGTLEATVSGDQLEGTMNGALGLANAVRAATFTLARSSSPATAAPGGS